MAVFGVGGLQMRVARGRVVVKVFPQSGETSVSSSTLVLRLTGYASVSDALSSEWSHISGLDLANPDFTSSDFIDILLGADVYVSILRNGLRKGNSTQPVTQKTIFGWILSRKIRTAGGSQEIATHQCIVGEPLSALVKKFWEQELPLSLTPLIKKK